MRNRLYGTLAVVSAAAILGLASPAGAQTYGPGYGPGYGGWMMGPGYGHGYVMGPGYGPGMMDYGYGRDDGYRRGRRYRGDRLCWQSTDKDRGYGYYAPCRN